MITSPKVKPNLGLNDSHLVANAATNTIKAYSVNGSFLWEKNCLLDGQNPNWRSTGGNTPPGLYKFGAVYNDYTPDPEYTRERASFGWLSFDMVDIEGNEDNNGRAGIMIHGGGSACGWDGAWQPVQMLYPTYGCIRMHNITLLDSVLPLHKKGTVYVSVYQK